MGVVERSGTDQDQHGTQGSLIMKIMGLASLLLIVLLITSSTASPQRRRSGGSSASQGTITNFLEIDLLKIQAIKCKIGNFLGIASLTAPCDDEFQRRVASVG